MGTLNITANDIDTIVTAIDKRLIPQTRDFDEYDEMPGCNGIYRIGDYGYVSEAQWEQAFADQPEWAPLAYELEANMYGDNSSEKVAAIAREGGMKALQGEADRLLDNDMFETVYYTEAGQEA
ncbi:hypothetical protein [Bifidobacterium thermophilum]|uniref:hypothetical protein n=1 Tax=Bifidobacterium thermophilum TaxID=33905 RepID=UPI003F8F431E